MKQEMFLGKNKIIQRKLNDDSSKVLRLKTHAMTGGWKYSKKTQRESSEKK